MKSLRSRMLAYLIPSTVILFTGAFALLGYEVSRTLNEYAYKTASQYAREGAASTEYRFRESIRMFENTALLVETLKREGRSDRTLLPEIFLETLKGNESVFSLWVLFEPNGWDGRDARFANTGGYDELGNYAVWAYREESGQATVSVEAWGAEAYKEDYYAAPKSKPGLWLGDPYEEEIDNGRTVRMITLARRLEDASGRIIGVAGIDFSIDFLGEILKTADRRSGGSSSLATKQGLILADTLSGAAGASLSDSQSAETDAAAASLTEPDAVEDLIVETRISGSPTLQMMKLIRLNAALDPWIFIVSMPKVKILDVPRRIYLELLVAELSVLALLTVLITAISRRISRPLVELTDTFDVIASGDLRPEVHIRARDETGRLADGFNQFTGTLSRLLGDVKNALRLLESNAGALSLEMERTESAFSDTDDSIETVVRRGADIDQGLKATAASVNEIKANISSLEAHSRGESELILLSVAAIEEMLASIRSVTGSVIQSGEHYNRLNDSSALGEELLSDVIERAQNILGQSENLLETNTVIANIASQTNLLSMNAAIEAAHAGEAGRGFAVVADEIRKLSENTAEQSTAVEKMLTEITGTIRSIAESSRKAGDNFGEIQALIKTITRLEEEMKLAMQEQSSGSNEILSSLDGMKSASQDMDRETSAIAVLAGRIGDAVEGLNRYSEEIQASIEAVRSDSVKIRSTFLAAAGLTENNRSNIRQVSEGLSIFHIKETNRAPGEEG